MGAKLIESGMRYRETARRLTPGMAGTIAPAPQRPTFQKPAAPPAQASGQLPPPPHAPAATATGYKPNWRYKINGKEVQTDAQGNMFDI